MSKVYNKEFKAPLQREIDDFLGKGLSEGLNPLCGLKNGFKGVFGGDVMGVGGDNVLDGVSDGIVRRVGDAGLLGGERVEEDYEFKYEFGGEKRSVFLNVGYDVAYENVSYDMLHGTKDVTEAKIDIVDYEVVDWDPDVDVSDFMLLDKKAVISKIADDVKFIDGLECELGESYDGGW